MNILNRFISILVTPRNSIESVVGPAICAFAIILIPLIAMQFSQEVNWDMFDFLIAWILIFGAGFTFQLISMKTEAISYKIATGLAVFASLAILWVNGAVGIIGNENNPVNFLFGFVLAMVILGSFIAQLEAKAMSRVMLSTAATHLLVSLIGGSLHVSQNPGASISGVININLIFVVLWGLSALFFRKAGMSNTIETEKPSE